MFATWRAKPRTSVNRNAQDACRPGGKVAQATASFVVMVVALCFSMKETNSASRRAGCRTDLRCERAQKQPATRRRRAAIAQGGDDGRADVREHRHPRSLATLGANEHLAGSPVDIIQGEGRNLVGPQAEPGQHHEDG